MAKQKFDIRRFLVEKYLVHEGEKAGLLPWWTSEVAMAYLFRGPIMTVGRSATLAYRVGMHYAGRGLVRTGLVKPASAKPIGPAYSVRTVPGGRPVVTHPGNIAFGSTFMALPVGLMIFHGAKIVEDYFAPPIEPDTF